MQRLFLVRCGMPFEIAFGCDDDFALAAFARFAEFEGNVFDWDTLAIVPRGS